MDDSNRQFVKGFNTDFTVSKLTVQSWSLLVRESNDKFQIRQMNGMLKTTKKQTPKSENYLTPTGVGGVTGVWSGN